jgi:hypothetical protein
MDGHGERLIYCPTIQSDLISGFLDGGQYKLYGLCNEPGISKLTE